MKKENKEIIRFIAIMLVVVIGTIAVFIYEITQFGFIIYMIIMSVFVVMQIFYLKKELVIRCK